MKNPWKSVSQVCLAGSFIVVALSMGEMASTRAKPESVPLIEDLAKIETTIREHRGPKAAFKAQPAATSRLIEERDFIAAAQEMSAIHDFLTLSLDTTEKSLLESLMQDEFSRGNPFDSLNNVYPLALILQKGVLSFERSAYRSPQFIGNLGYDVLKYEIQHRDQTRSHILAYKEKTAPAQVVIGSRDNRPVFSLFLVPHDQDQVYMSIFESGKPITNQVVSTEVALNSVMRRVDSSTPLLSARSSHDFK